MKRVVMMVLGVLLLAAPAFAQAAKDAKPADKPAPKTLTADGKVSAVAEGSLKVKGKDAEWTFVVDKDTTVVTTGGNHKMDALKADKKPTLVTEFVKNGDEVTVKYHDLGATKHAATITIQPPPAAAAKKK